MKGKLARIARAKPKANKATLHPSTKETNKKALSAVQWLSQMLRLDKWTSPLLL
jgi:hypothetical protein